MIAVEEAVAADVLLAALLLVYVLASGIAPPTKFFSAMRHAFGEYVEIKAAK
ncbi:MAG: hypothetical protein ACTHLY_19470 [Pseudolabrys sp.]